MKENSFAELTDEELLKKKKLLKVANIISAVFIGFMIGVALYSTVRNGFGLFTFFPLFFIPVAASNRANASALRKELALRNLD